MATNYWKRMLLLGVAGAINLACGVQGVLVDEGNPLIPKFWWQLVIEKHVKEQFRFDTEGNLNSVIICPLPSAMA